MPKKSLIPPTINTVTGEPSWRYRRFLAYWLVGFCCFVIGGLGILPPIADTVVNRTIVEGAFWLAFTVFLLYGGYATISDVTAFIVTKSGRPFAPPQAGSTEKTTVETTVVQHDPPTSEGQQTA